MLPVHFLSLAPSSRAAEDRHSGSSGDYDAMVIGGGLILLLCSHRHWPSAAVAPRTVLIKLATAQPLHFVSCCYVTKRYYIGDGIGAEEGLDWRCTVTVTAPYTGALGHRAIARLYKGTAGLYQGRAGLYQGYIRAKAGLYQGTAGLYQGHNRVTAGLYQGQSRAVYQGHCRAVSGPLQGYIRAQQGYIRATAGSQQGYIRIIAGL